MSQKQIARLVYDFIKHVDNFLLHHALMQDRPKPGDFDSMMAARDNAEQSGKLLAEALAENHAAESNGVRKMVELILGQYMMDHYIAEADSPDDTYAMWPDLRERLTALATAEAVTANSKPSTKRGRPAKYDAASEQRLVDDLQSSGLNLPQFAHDKGIDRKELEWRQP